MKKYIQLAKNNVEHSMLGAVMFLMFQVQSRWRYPIGNLRIWLEVPLSLSQVALFVDRSNEIIGYLSWGFFSPRTVSLMKSNANFVPHVSDWTDGTELWIIDVIAIEGSFAAIIECARREMFQNFKTVNWLKREKRTGDGSRIEVKHLTKRF